MSNKLRKAFYVVNLLNIIMVLIAGIYLYIPTFIVILFIPILALYPISRILAAILICINIVLALTKKISYLTAIIFIILHLLYILFIFEHLLGFFAGV